MITEFQLLDNVGKVIGEGEIENAEAHHHDDSDRDGESHEGTSSLSPRTSAVYRLFSVSEFPNVNHQEFETLEAMFAASEGVAIQPLMFPCLARTRQLGLFPEDRKK